MSNLSVTKSNLGLEDLFLGTGTQQVPTSTGGMRTVTSISAAGVPLATGAGTAGAAFTTQGITNIDAALAWLKNNAALSTASNTFSGLQTLTAGLTVSSGGATITAGGLSLTGQNNPVSINPGAIVGDTVYQVAGKNALGILPGYVGSSMTSTLFVNTASGTEGASFPNLKLWGAVAIPQTLNVTGATTLAALTATTGTFSGNLALTSSSSQANIGDNTALGAPLINLLRSDATWSVRNETAFRIYGNGGTTATTKQLELSTSGALWIAAGLTATSGTFNGNILANPATASAQIAIFNSTAGNDANFALGDNAWQSAGTVSRWQMNRRSDNFFGAGTRGLTFWGDASNNGTTPNYLAPLMFDTSGNVYLAYAGANGASGSGWTNGNVLVGTKLGIGTTNPNAPLEVDNNSPNYSGGNTAPASGFRLYRAGVTGSSWGNAIDFNVSRYSNATTNSYTQLDLKLANGQTNNPDTVVLSLLGNGNVGIGTTSPQARLDLGLFGSYNVVSHENVFLAQHQDIGNSGNGSTLDITLAFSGTDSAFPTGKMAQIKAVKEQTWASGVGLSFHTTNASTGVVNEVLRISNDQKVYVGATSDDGSGAKLQTNGTVSMAGLRINAAPTASSTARSHSLPINLNGTTYYLMLSATA